MTYTGVTATSFTGVTRGTTVDTVTSTATAHANGASIRLHYFKIYLDRYNQLTTDDDKVVVEQAISSGFTGTQSLSMVNTATTLNSFITITSTAASDADFVTGTDAMATRNLKQLPNMPAVHTQKQKHLH